MQTGLAHNGADYRRLTIWRGHTGFLEKLSLEVRGGEASFASLKTLDVAGDPLSSKLVSLSGSPVCIDGLSRSTVDMFGRQFFWGPEDILPVPVGLV